MKVMITDGQYYCKKYRLYVLPHLAKRSLSPGRRFPPGEPLPLPLLIHLE